MIAMHSSKAIEGNRSKFCVARLRRGGAEKCLGVGCGLPGM